MKKIIGGKRYDTEAAVSLCTLGCDYSKSDFKWHSTELYRTQRGAFFLAGKGNAASMWAEHRPGESHSGSGIRPLSDDEAREVLESEGETELVEAYFEVEDA